MAHLNINYLIILVAVIAASIVRGFRDKRIENLYDDKSEREDVEKWHSLTFYIWVILALAISYAFFKTLTYNIILLTIHFGFIVMLYLNSTLNLIKKKDIYYLGEMAGTDKKLKKYEKQVFVGLMVINTIGIYYFLTLK